MKKVTIAFLVLIVACAAFLFVKANQEPKVTERTPVYLASTGGTVDVYTLDKKTKEMSLYKSLSRGSEVTSQNLTYEPKDSEEVYTRVELSGDVDEKGNPNVYYVNNADFVTDVASTVRETTKYVRTPVTIYESADSYEIASFAPKGTELAVTGFSNMAADGSVEMYQVEYEGVSGYVFAKYLVDTKEDADAVYESVYNIQAGRQYDYDLLSGYTENLDWYPVDKPVLERGEIPEETKCIYLCAEAAHPDYIDGYIELALETGANALVINIKDGMLSYYSEVADIYTPTSNYYSYLSVEDFKTSIQKVRDAGLWAIGRIVVFNDDFYAQDHPEDCITTDISDLVWISAYARNCWEYNIALATEAVELFDFDEIQFDYIRFPDNAYALSCSEWTDFKNTYDEEKGQCIQNFCFYACDMVHRAGAYCSADVFGDSAEEYITPGGQYWAAISNVVDAISGMPYTDHFGSDVDRWTYPYDIVYTWAQKAAARQSEIATPAIARTWITGYDTPYWNQTVTYGNEQLVAQAQALYDGGLYGGFIPWNAASSLNKYWSYYLVWATEYH